MSNRGQPVWQSSQSMRQHNACWVTFHNRTKGQRVTWCWLAKESDPCKVTSRSLRLKKSLRACCQVDSFELLIPCVRTPGLRESTSPPVDCLSEDSMSHSSLSATASSCCSSKRQVPMSKAFDWPKHSSALVPKRSWMTIFGTSCLTMKTYPLKNLLSLFLANSGSSKRLFRPLCLLPFCGMGIDESLGTAKRPKTPAIPKTADFQSDSR